MDIDNNFDLQKLKEVKEESLAPSSIDYSQNFSDSPNSISSNNQESEPTNYQSNRNNQIIPLQNNNDNLEENPYFVMITNHKGQTEEEEEEHQQNLEEKNIGKPLLSKEDIIEYLKKVPEMKKFIDMLKIRTINNKILRSMYKKNKTSRKWFSISNKKLGRKRKEDNIKRENEKYSSDNMIKKNKVFLINAFYDWFENIKKKLPERNKYILKKLKQKEKTRINTNIDLKMLDSQLVDLFIIKVKDRNKNNTEEIDKNEIIINKILNMNFREWIDILLMKKESEIEGIKIDEFYSHLNNLFEENGKDEDYICNVIFCLYNYERWFKCKIPRASKKSNKNPKE